MGSRWVWAAQVIGACVIVGCAGGESDSVGDLGFSAGPGQVSAGETGDGTGTTSGEDTGPGPTSSVGTTAPSTSPTQEGSDTDPTTGPLLDCMFADECDDGDLCTEDNCVNSTCANVPIACDDGVDCTVDACDPATGACSNTADDAVCIDADLCNGTESCDALSGCVAGTEVMCSDGLACTADACDPATGQCSNETIEACASADGCCPVGCSVADTDCTCSNLATSATASSSGGGLDANGYGPSRWVDGNGEASCDGNCTQCFGWILNSSSASGAWMQLDWASPVLIGSMFIDGIDPGGCQSTARGLAGGNVQYWGPGGWTTASTFAGEQGDVAVNFNPPVTTTALRIYNALTPPGGSNSLAFEWYVYEPLGCTP